jgi:hypothetical protein
MSDETQMVTGRRPPTVRTWLAFGASLAAVLVILALMVVACQDRPVPTGADRPDGTPTPGASASDGAGGDQGGDDQDGDDQDSDQPTGPVIHYFRVAVGPDCPDPAEITLEWSVTGTEEVVLSVDGPGGFDRYRPEDSATLHFPCDGDPHSYLITAEGDGQTETSTIDVPAMGGTP